VSIRKTWLNSPSLPSYSPAAGLAAPSTFAEEAASASTIASTRNSGLRVKAGVALLIPAFRPGRGLVDLVKSFREAVNDLEWDGIVVVDDGSGSEYAHIFLELSALDGVQVIPHAVNLGKGAALKAGMNFILCAFPNICGVVTADADGQHDPLDVARVRDRFLQNPGSLVLGVRTFGRAVPFRSRIGNQITRRVTSAVLGQRLGDTQTGLRAIPAHLVAGLLRVPAAGYEFESEMLVAVKHLCVPVTEQPIRTIYEPDNPSSHFQPLRDSIRIYSVLLRFSFISILTAVLDNAVFFMLWRGTGNIGLSQAGARAVAVLFNYSVVRRKVFLSEEKHRLLLPRYLLVVLANGLISYLGIWLLTGMTSAGVVPAKILAEAALFLANFILQRDFVFSKRATEPDGTDWDQYYQHVPYTARFTRRYTESVLIGILRSCFFTPDQTILEIGGANSCFLDGLTRTFRPRVYHVVDKNQYGLDLLAQRATGRSVQIHHGDVLALSNLGATADVVMSIGLIEHFNPEGTRRAVEAHFQCLEEGGYAIISFPTPTLLYRLVRGVAEAAGVWRFPDERPLQPQEVREVASRFGPVVLEKTLWPLILTQHLIVVRKADHTAASIQANSSAGQSGK